MSRVICDLPNASLEISGVRFQKLEDGRFISDEIGDEATAIFLSIPGYVLDEDEAEPVKLPVSEPAASPKTKKQLAAEKAAEKAAAAKPAVVVETTPVIPADEPAPPADLDAGNADANAEPAAVTGEGAAPTDPVNPEDAPKADNVF